LEESEAIYRKETDQRKTDSADHERLAISKEELVAMLQEEELKNASLLVFANKQDLEVLFLFFF